MVSFSRGKNPGLRTEEFEAGGPGPRASSPEGWGLLRSGGEPESMGVCGSLAVHVLECSIEHLP